MTSAAWSCLPAHFAADHTTMYILLLSSLALFRAANKIARFNNPLRAALFFIICALDDGVASTNEDVASFDVLD